MKPTFILVRNDSKSRGDDGRSKRASAFRASAFVTAAVALLGGNSLSAAPPNKPHAEGRILVQPRSGLSDTEFDKIIKEKGARRQLGKLRNLNVRVIEVPPQAEEAIARALAGHKHIKYAEVDKAVPADATANDPKFGQAWHFNKIGVPTAWDTAQGANVIVAVLDTGVEQTHADLGANLVPGWNSVSNNSDSSDVQGHGTNVAGVISAITNNGVGVASIAYQSKVMPVRITNDSAGWAYWSDVANGLTWAADHGAHIANISYDVSGSSTVANAAQYMRNKGGLVFVAAGNTGVQQSYAPSTTMVSVAATDSADGRASFSSYGSFVDLAAPGSGILTTGKGGAYWSVNGTSFASPAAAAVAALVRSAKPQLSNSEIEAILRNTAKDLGTAGVDPYFGSGRVDAAAAVQMALNAVPSDTQAPSTSIGSPTSGANVSGIVPIAANASDNFGVMRVELYVNGALFATDYTGPYSFSWDSSALGSGTANLMTKAYDAANNVGTSSTVSVNVANGPLDTQAPSVTLTSPLNGATVGSSVTVTASASDNVKVTKLTITAGGKTICNVTTATASCNWKLPRKAGPYSVTATAQDAAGNSASASASVIKK